MREEIKIIITVFCLYLSSCATSQYNCAQYCALEEGMLCHSSISKATKDFNCRPAQNLEEKNQVASSTKQALNLEKETNKKNTSAWSWSAVGALIIAILVMIVSKDEDSNSSSSSSY